MWITVNTLVWIGFALYLLWNTTRIPIDLTALYPNICGIECESLVQLIVCAIKLVLMTQLYYYTNIKLLTICGKTLASLFTFCSCRRSQRGATNLLCQHPFHFQLLYTMQVYAAWNLILFSSDAGVSRPTCSIIKVVVVHYSFMLRWFEGMNASIHVARFWRLENVYTIYL